MIDIKPKKYIVYKERKQYWNKIIKIPLNSESK